MRTKSMPNITQFTQKIPPKYPKRLVIIRHGQSEQNAALDLMDPDIESLSKTRDADIQLTEIGKWQVKSQSIFLTTTRPL